MIGRAFWKVALALVKASWYRLRSRAESGGKSGHD
jgi:hypothetical protein